MKVKFFGTPNMLIKERKKKKLSLEVEYKPIFRFDSNGEYVTEDKDLIEKLRNRFKCEDMVEIEDMQEEQKEEEVINDVQPTTSRNVKPAIKRVGSKGQQRQRTGNGSKSSGKR